jgi:hypothetical protein
MEHVARVREIRRMAPRSRSLWASRAVLGLAALDSVASGGWALLHPEDVFAWLQIPAPKDAFLLPVLGGLLVAQGLCLVAALLRPAAWAGFVWVPLLGRLLLAGFWLWLLGSGRVPTPTALLLLAHEALWLPGFAIFLMTQRFPMDQGTE